MMHSLYSVAKMAYLLAQCFHFNYDSALADFDEGVETKVVVVGWG